MSAKDASATPSSRSCATPTAAGCSCMHARSSSSAAPGQRHGRSSRPYGMETLGLSRGDAGGLTLPSGVAFLLAAYPTARLAERFGRLRTMAVGMAHLRVRHAPGHVPADADRDRRRVLRRRRRCVRVPGQRGGRAVEPRPVGAGLRDLRRRCTPSVAAPAPSSGRPWSAWRSTCWDGPRCSWTWPCSRGIAVVIVLRHRPAAAATAPRRWCERGAHPHHHRLPARPATRWTPTCGPRHQTGPPPDAGPS